MKAQELLEGNGDILVDVLKAGVWTDALVEERVFGRELVRDERNYRGVEVVRENGRADLPFYSTSLSTVWMAAEKLRGDGWLVVVKAMPESGSFLAGSDWTRDPQVKAPYVCEISRLPYGNDREKYPQGQRAFWAYADTAPLAIARAVLKVAAAADEAAERQAA